MLAILHMLIMLAALLQLGWIAYDDLRHLRIKNSANISLALTYFVSALVFQTWGEIATHVATALFMLLLLVWPFARNMLGGGDVKFLVVAALWIGPNNLSLFSIALLVSLILYFLCARAGVLRMHAYGKLHRIPFGPSGALAMAFVLVNSSIVFAISTS